LLEDETVGQSMRAFVIKWREKRTNLRSLPWLVTIGLVITVGSTRTVDAAFESNDSTWQGFSELYALARSLVGAERSRIVASIDYKKLNPSDALLIVHPEASLNHSSLSAFLQAGGRVAVIDDFGSAEPFLERFSIRRLSAPANPEKCLRDNRNLPIATPVETQVGKTGGSRHPIAEGINEVILNHPTALENPGTLTTILEIRLKDATTVPVAVAGVVGNEHAGRLFVMSDPSAFMNLMLRYSGNRRFAHSLIRYLIEDDGRAGKGKLYIVANRFEQRGDFGTGFGPLSNALDSIKQLIRELRNGLPVQILVLLVVVTLVGIARWVYVNAVRPGTVVLPKFLRAVPLFAQAGWPGHAAALMSPSTDPALIVLELRAAFREQLTRRLSVDSGINSTALLSLIEEQRLLAPRHFEDLKRYVAELDGYERAIAVRHRVRVRSSTLNRLLAQGRDILNHVSQVEIKRREPSPSSE
jgi:hypothetical protein